MQSLIHKKYVSILEFIAEILLCKEFPSILYIHSLTSQQSLRYNTIVNIVNDILSSNNPIIVLESVINNFDKINVSNFSAILSNYIVEKTEQLESKAHYLCNQLITTQEHKPMSNFRNPKLQVKW